MRDHKISKFYKIKYSRQIFFILSKLEFGPESLHMVLDGHDLKKQDALDLITNLKSNSTFIFQTAKELRNTNKGNVISFSKKSFFNIINLCRDTCSYCTYKSEPNESKISMMEPNNVVELAKLAKKYHCTEALFVTGERPEDKYELARNWLKKNNFTSTAEYLIHCSEIVLEQGVFPHTNAGNLTKNEMRELKKTNVSMGLMLENVSARLRGKGMPHESAISKEPSARLEVLNNAGELKIPMTTGILVGIGETIEEIIDSIFAIKQIHEKFGNVQEVILQNFLPKPDTKMNNHETPSDLYFKTVVALCRIIIPNSNIQIPPNLSPYSYQEFLSVGINDWGGISPLTSDYVNPECGWPEINTVEENCKKLNFQLKARFPVYPEFFPLVDNNLKQKLTLIADADNYVKGDYWR